MEQVSEDVLRDMRKYGKDVTGPIVYAYTEWVISKAVRLGIRRLWFLARDGYLPYLMAKRICAFRGVNIDCRYLYCSRKSLRSASYHLISDAELESQLFVYGYHVSAESFLARFDISEQKAREIIGKVNIERANEPLGRKKFSRICDALRDDADFFKNLRLSAKEKYTCAVEYFKSAGLFESESVCIVDSGWTGSIQHSLGVLVDSVGYKGKLTGFYFGMYVENAPRYGDRFTYYFSARKGFLRRALFNNNLFECMLSAPHPMTEKYALINGRYVPCFRDVRPYEMHLIVLAQISGALCYADEENAKNETKTKAEKSENKIFRKVCRAMIFPTKREAHLFSSFLFCDDTTEKYMHSLSDRAAISRLREYTVFARILRRLGVRKELRGELFWPYGVTAYLPSFSRIFYRANLLIWDIIKSARYGLRAWFSGGE